MSVVFFETLKSISHNGESFKDLGLLCDLTFLLNYHIKNIPFSVLNSFYHQISNLFFQWVSRGFSPSLNCLWLFKKKEKFQTSPNKSYLDAKEHLTPVLFHSVPHFLQFVSVQLTKYVSHTCNQKKKILIRWNITNPWLGLSMTCRYLVFKQISPALITTHVNKY